MQQLMPNLESKAALTTPTQVQKQSDLVSPTKYIQVPDLNINSGLESPKDLDEFESMMK